MITTVNIDKFLKNIGRKCTKICSENSTHKQFLSKSLVNTIKGVKVHPKLLIPLYTFVEDYSEIECSRIAIVDESETIVKLPYIKLIEEEPVEDVNIEIKEEPVSDSESNALF